MFFIIRVYYKLIFRTSWCYHSMILKMLIVMELETLWLIVIYAYLYVVSYEHCYKCNEDV